MGETLNRLPENVQRRIAELDAKRPRPLAQLAQVTQTPYKPVVMAPRPYLRPRAGKGHQSKYDSPTMRRLLMVYGLPEPTFEHRFHPVRLWRLDIAWPAYRLCVEIQGGVFQGGRHSRGQGMVGDFEKFNALTELGWRLLLCTPDGLITAGFLDMLKRVFDTLKRPINVPNGAIVAPK
jgi:hypothetical protein